MPNSFPILVNSGSASRTTAKLMKTGQTTSYRTGDDGDLEAGREVDFFTLAENNPFGNTNRFTDELGGQTYTNNIVIDWSTYDGSTVLGYYYTGSALNNLSWDDAIDTALSHTVGTFTDNWKLPNISQLYNLCNFVGGNKLDYTPFNLGSSIYTWSSTTSERNSSTALALLNAQSSVVSEYPKQYSRTVYFFTRNFTVTGTTLT